MSSKHALLYLITTIVLFCCGGIFGVYMRKLLNDPTNTAHIIQWGSLCIPYILTTVTGTWLFNATIYNSNLSKFAKGALLIVYFIIPGVGYVLGYNVISNL
jgi:hypothetical protein